MSANDLWFPVHVAPDEQLVIVNGGVGGRRLCEPIDFAEALDAANEDENGELPYRVVRERGPWIDGKQTTETCLEPNPDYQQPRRITVTIGQQDFRLAPDDVAAELERSREVR